MKTFPFRQILVGSLLSFASLAPAQTNFSKIDEQARQVEFSKKQNLPQLASALTASLQTETEKARAIFVWVTANIRYDAKLIADDDVEAETFKAKQQSPEVLRTKKAVCEGYANLFNDLCQAAGLKSLVATGLTKTRTGRIPKIGHAWNLVRADGDWKLIDATWGAGSLDDDQKYVAAFDDKYFFSDAKSFVVNHYPSDPLFQLLEKPVDLVTFKARPGDPAATPPTAAGFTIPNLKDSLNYYIGLDSQAARLNSALRTLRADPTNSQANFSVAFYQFNVSNQSFMEYWIAQKQMMEKSTRPSLEEVKKGDEQLLLIQKQLAACQQSITRIPIGGQYYRAGQSLQKAVSVNVKSCQEALQRNLDLEKRLKGKG